MGPVGTEASTSLVVAVGSEASPVLEVKVGVLLVVEGVESSREKADALREVVIDDVILEDDDGTDGIALLWLNREESKRHAKRLTCSYCL